MVCVILYSLALLCKPIVKGLFSNIILRRISPHLKFIVQVIGLHTTELALIVEISRFGLILQSNGMPNQKVKEEEIKLIPIQPPNAV